MCFSFNASLITFIIGTIGTIYNLYEFKDNTLYTCINIYWYLPILMQLWEAIIWKGYKCKLFSKIAMTTNLLQPIITSLLLTLSNRDKLTNYDIPIVLTILIIYCGYVGRFFFREYGCIKERDGINYKWWNNNYGGLIYDLTMVILLLLLLKDRKILAFQLGFCIITLALSAIFYKRKSGGSIWCFLAAFAPIYNYIIFKFVSSE